MIKCKIVVSGNRSSAPRKKTRDFFCYDDSSVSYVPLEKGTEIKVKNDSLY